MKLEFNFFSKHLSENPDFVVKENQTKSCPIKRNEYFVEQIIWHRQ